MQPPERRDRLLSGALSPLKNVVQDSCGLDSGDTFG